MSPSEDTHRHISELRLFMDNFYNKVWPLYKSQCLLICNKAAEIQRLFYGRARYFSVLLRDTV